MSTNFGMSNLNEIDVILNSERHACDSIYNFRKNVLKKYTNLLSNMHEIQNYCIFMNRVHFFSYFIVYPAFGKCEHKLECIKNVTNPLC